MLKRLVGATQTPLLFFLFNVEKLAFTTQNSITAAVPMGFEPTISRVTGEQHATNMMRYYFPLLEGYSTLGIEIDAIKLLNQVLHPLGTD